MMMGVHHNQSLLDEKIFSQGISELSARDRHLANIITQWGCPPFWIHSPGFSGLVLAILSQQVSIESAQATYSKLENSAGSITPEKFLSLDVLELQSIGFSRQKSSYVRGIAQEIIAGGLILDELEELENELVRSRLLKLKGVGPWTADTYLLFSLRRSDAWPSGDLALEKAVQEMRGLSKNTSTEEVDKIAVSWKPWRAVAARILWHYYLSKRSRSSAA
jgi:DNA-3-methyladenine glycosylase II